MQLKLALAVSAFVVLVLAYAASPLAAQETTVLPPPTTEPPATTAPPETTAAPTTAPPQTTAAPATTAPTTTKRTTTTVPLTTTTPEQLPTLPAPVTDPPAPGATTADTTDLASVELDSSIDPLFPALSIAGFVTALLIVATQWFLTRKPNRPTL